MLAARPRFCRHLPRVHPADLPRCTQPVCSTVCGRVVCRGAPSLNGIIEGGRRPSLVGERRATRGFVSASPTTSGMGVPVLKTTASARAFQRCRGILPHRMSTKHVYTYTCLHTCLHPAVCRAAPSLNGIIGSSQRPSLVGNGVHMLARWKRSGTSKRARGSALAEVEGKKIHERVRRLRRDSISARHPVATSNCFDDIGNGK